MEELCHTIDIKSPYGSQYDNMTLEEFVKQQGAGEKALGTVSLWTRAMLVRQLFCPIQSTRVGSKVGPYLSHSIHHPCTGILLRFV